jgi:LCP family protein required for cell wall assembly
MRGDFMAQNKRNGPAHAKTKAKAEKKRTKRHPLAIVATIFLSLLGVFCICISGVLLMFKYNRNAELDALTNEQLAINETLDDDVINIALFGIDTRNLSSFRGNSDSIMILSIDNTHDSIKITSIMRDSIVPIEGHGVKKINAAYAEGGPELAIKTLNQVFNLNIRDYATVNFLGMSDIIDAVGGIEINITEAERQHINGNMYALHVESGTPFYPIEKAGYQALNGTQAVTFARLRKVSTSSGERDDFGRTDRQRFVLEQLFNKATSMSKTKYPALIKSLLPYMETSLTYSDIFSMAGILSGNIEFKQTRIPQDYAMEITENDYPPSLGSVLYYNLDYATEMLHAFIYDDILTTDYIKDHPVVKTPWYTTWKQNNP